MVYSTLEAHGDYRALGPRFCVAFDYLRSFRGTWQPGRIDLIPDEVWLTTIQKNAARIEDADLEYHKRFADLHYCVAGRDEFGWAPDLAGRSMVAPYNPEKDFGLVQGPPREFLPLFGNRFAIVFGGEPHMGHIGAGEITRVCFKIRMDDAIL